MLDAEGNELVAQNADEPFVPASVTKIVTAWLAMEVLGGDYRFETRFYLDDKRVLYVRGGGDPFLISEELAPLATELVAAVGKQLITGIVLDASYYPSNLRISGIEDIDEDLREDIIMDVTEELIAIKLEALVVQVGRWKGVRSCAIPS